MPNIILRLHNWLITGLLISAFVYAPNIITNSTPTPSLLSMHASQAIERHTPQQQQANAVLRAW